MGACLALDSMWMLGLADIYRYLPSLKTRPFPSLRRLSPYINRLLSTPTHTLYRICTVHFTYYHHYCYHSRLYNTYRRTTYNLSSRYTISICPIYLHTDTYYCCKRPISFLAASGGRTRNPTSHIPHRLCSASASASASSYSAQHSSISCPRHQRQGPYLVCRRTYRLHTRSGSRQSALSRRHLQVYLIKEGFESAQGGAQI